MAELLYGNVFAQIAALLVLAAALGFVGTMLRQPLIVSFIIVGIVAGPSVLDLVHAHEEIELLSELGIAILLFLVGLKLDVNLIRSLGLSSLGSGVVQVLATAAIGIAATFAVGMGWVEALYIGAAIAFSSTIVIVKLLSDNREIDALHGQLALGFLIVQDIVVVVAMIALSAVGVGSEENGGSIWVVLGAGVALIAVVALFVRVIAEPLTERLATVPELLISFAIAFAALFAAAADFAGLGKELGGLLAGVALASTRYREAIGSRLAPLRDFLLLFFFVSLGAEIELSGLGSNLFAAAAFSVVVLVVKPAIIMAILGVMGYSKRPAFLGSVSLAQISEFSLILAGIGATMGHISDDLLGLVALVALVTIAASSYMIAFDDRLFAIAEPVLSWLERKGVAREHDDDEVSPDGGYDVVIFGLGRFGLAIALRLKSRGTKILGVDFNPSAVRRARANGIDVEYGEAADPEFVAGLPLDGVKWAVCTVPVHETGLVHGDTRIGVVQSLRGAGYIGHIALTSHRESEVERLIAAGADMVLEPFQDAADRATELLIADGAPERIPIEAIAGEVDGAKH